MGDRCYLEVTVHREDVAKFCAATRGAFGIDEFSEDGLAEVGEANYGLNVELEAAAAAGARFYGWHSDGAGYSGLEFCSEGDGTLHAVVTATEVGMVVSVDDNGNPSRRCVENTRSTCAALKRLKPLITESWAHNMSRAYAEAGKQLERP